MKYKQTKTIGEEVLKTLEPHIVKGAVVGSIRREKANVYDIDLVVIPKKEFRVFEVIKKVFRPYGTMAMEVMEGNQIIRVIGDDNIKINCYLANDKNFEILKLNWKGKATKT